MYNSVQNSTAEYGTTQYNTSQQSGVHVFQSITKFRCLFSGQPSQLDSASRK